MTLRDEEDCELERQRSLGTRRLQRSFLAEDTRVPFPKLVSESDQKFLLLVKSHQETAPATFQDAKARTLV